jgi:hypothetical protein
VAACAVDEQALHPDQIVDREPLRRGFPMQREQRPQRETEVVDFAGPVAGGVDVVAFGVEQEGRA